MQDEINEKTVALYIKTGKLTAEVLQKAMKAALAQSKKTLLWLSRPSGTYCFRERDVFISDTAPHNTWRFYKEQTRDHILAYAVELTGVQDGKDKYKVIIVFCGLIVCNVFMYFLYDVRMEPILYTTFLLILLVLPFAFRDLHNTYQKCERLNNIKQAKLPATPDLGAADTLVEESYQQIIKAILQTWQNERANQRKINAERDDYYTLWTHQIKTPVYSMDLMLQTGDTTPSKWKTELLQISCYIDMALKYLQLENQYSDLFLERVELLPLAQEAIKKHSVVLISKRLKIDLHDLNGTVLTDRKWLLFILEQLVSNAAKYTEQGCISIYQPTPLQICVSDTGIGITAEDLPRL